jgi:hypothetical protein
MREEWKREQESWEDEAAASAQPPPDDGGGDTQRDLGVRGFTAPAGEGDGGAPPPRTDEGIAALSLREPVTIPSAFDVGRNEFA